MLQTRVGKRTGVAALRMAVEMTKQKGWKISKEEAVRRVTADHLDSVLHPQFSAGASFNVLTTALAASPGAAVGKVYFTADDTVDAVERGEAAILVRNETSPEDVHGMAVAEGILTAKGGLVSHAAVVARGWGKPAVVGAEQVKISGKQFRVGETVVREGEVISLDGSTGQVVVGAVDLTVGSTPPEFDTILGWADEIRKGGKGVRGLKVRANADNGPDATRAREFGAEGIGLCRTEHMFLGEDRLPIVRAMILADTAEESAAALEQLRAAQKADYLEILEAMDGLPVTVRLLDPPLHEFLPNVEELAIKQATTGLTSEETELLAAARSWHEVNPMLGTRGVRLGVVKPGLYEMQVRALMEAAADRK
jgi:pyruvate,orthophosphate dikinase